MAGLLGLPVAGHGAHGVAGHVLPDLGPGRLAHTELAEVDVVPGALDADLLRPERKRGGNQWLSELVQFSAFGSETHVMANKAHSQRNHFKLVLKVYFFAENYLRKLTHPIIVLRSCNLPISAC